MFNISAFMFTFQGNVAFIHSPRCLVLYSLRQQCSLANLISICLWLKAAILKIFDLGGSYPLTTYSPSLTRSGYTISCALIGSRKPKHCLDRERTKAEGNGERTEIHSTFIQKFIVLQRGYHNARRLNKMI